MGSQDFLGGTHVNLVHVKGPCICKKGPLERDRTFKIFRRKGSAIPTDPTHINYWVRHVSLWQMFNPKENSKVLFSELKIGI